MFSRPTERKVVVAAVAYAIGTAVATLIFWVVGKITRRPPRPGPQPVRGRRRRSLAEAPGPARPTSIVAYEPRDANARNVALVGLGFLIVLSLIVGVTTLFFVGVTGSTPTLQAPPPGVAISAQAPTPLPPPPRLETQPGQELAEMQGPETLALNSYAWIDRSKGIVRIPIDRAMDVVAATGLPARPAAEQEGFQDEGLTVPSGSSSGRATEVLLH